MASPIRSVLLALTVFAGVLISGCTGGGDADAPATIFQHIHGLAVDPGDSGVLFVATHGGVIRGRDDADWTYLGTDRSDYMGFSLHPTDNRTAYSSGHPERGGNQGIRKSTDGASTWTTIALSGQVDCHAMTIGRADPDRIYCWSSAGRFYRSSDGSEFQAVTPVGLPGAILTLATPAERAEVVYAGTTKGIYASQDAGTTWAAVPGSPAHATTALAAAADDPNRFLAYFAGGGLGLQTSDDSGATWRASGGGLPADFQATNIALDPSDDAVAYAAAGTRIAKTTDGGATWAIIRFGP